MLKDFKAFLLRGNVVDLAVAVVIGAAFGRVVTALVENIVTPILAIPGGADFSGLHFEINGSLYSEMHVDGAITRSLFIYPRNLDLRQEVDADANGMRIGTIYLVRNTKLEPDYQPVAPSILRIAERSIWTLIKSAGLADVTAIEDQARRDGWVL